VALVTRDRDLARRVAAELRRWEIAVDDSAGMPLALTRSGAFLRLIAVAAGERLAPVALLALLKHPLTRLGQDSAATRQTVRRLELAVLRGPRPAPGIEGLRDALDGGIEGAAELHGLVDRLEQALGPLLAETGRPRTPLARLVERHDAAALALARGPGGDDGGASLWGGDDGLALPGFIAELGESAPGYGMVDPRAGPAPRRLGPGPPSRKWPMHRRGSSSRPSHGARLSTSWPCAAWLQREPRRFFNGAKG
jgi:ATP-dependent helicase/nuclease subunit B